MKNSLLCLLLFVCGHTYAQTVYPGGVTGCIARWDFANTGGPISSVPDVSGNGNNSSSVNALAAAQGFRNVPNKAMSFNGTSSVANIPNAANLVPANITMAAVVKMNGFFSGPCNVSQILNKGYPNFVAGNYGLGFGDNAYDGSCSVFSPNNQQLAVFLGNNTTSPAAGNYVTTNQWYFVAASFNGTTVRYYQVPMDPANYVSNVTPIYTFSNLTAIGTNTQDISIGRHLNPLYPYWFNGAMEEVTLFNKALSSTEIQSVYDYLWGIVKITSVSNTTLSCGQAFTVNYSVNNSSFFAATNTFAVEMSNATGSFATPTTVGSVVATGGGTINCTAPSTLPSGTGYRLRIVASNVAYTTADNGANISLTTIAKPTAGSNTPVCAGQTLNLTGSSSTPGVTYNWSGPGFTSSSQNPSIPNVSAVNAGNYLLTASLNGCTSPADTEVVVIGSNQLPTATNYISPDDTICSGATVAFLVLVTNGGSNTQYQWMKNGIDIPGETNSSFSSKVLITGDVINCKVTVVGCNATNSVTSNSFTITVMDQSAANVGVTANPGVELSPWQLVTFTAHPTNGGTNPVYQWKLNGVDILGAVSDTWSANNLNNNDIITVVLTSNSPCAAPPTATSQPLIVKIKTAVDDVQNDGYVSLYPNPNNGSFIIGGNFQGAADATVEVLDVTGQVVYSEHITLQPSLRKEIQLTSSLPNGLYILKLKAGGISQVIRFSIQK